ncbi:PAS domain S-box protein [Aquabacterium soli]|uniref:histidine kinase n=1 Tax=Aquabacterium soli TaxID=2493092 RepID=A0A426VBK5_9BURK|nr:PAS domain S-box protein [Aquabacterium soli]RRS04244.1 PAS domain S-box protein [Aquabacterium soli]
MAWFQRGGRRSLFAVLALAVFLGLGVPAALIGGFMVGVRAPEQARQQQVQDLASRLEVLSTSLPYLIWTFDDTAMADVVQAMMKSPEVVRVVVTDADARGVLVDVSRPAAKHAQVIESQHDIHFRDKLIGHVRLAMDDRLLQAGLRQQRLFYALMVGLQVLVSLALILVLLHSRIARPLRALGAFADDLAEGRFQTRLERRHNDEIGRLGERLEHMRESLRRLFEEQHLLLQRLRAEEARTLRQARFYEAVSRSNRFIVRQRGAESLNAEICRICVETGHALMAGVWELDDARVSLAASSGQAPSVPPQGLPGLLAGPDLSPVPMLFDGRVVVCNDLQTEAGAGQRAPGGESASGAPELRALAALPIRHGGQVSALLVLYAGEPGVFDEPVVALLDEMVSDLSFALDNADREASRQRAVQAVEAGYARFQRVFGAMPLPAAIHALDDGQILEVNEATCEFHGLSRPQMVGRRWQSLGVGLSPQELSRLDVQVESLGAVRDVETRVCMRTGQWRDVLFHAERIEFTGRECILTITVDITERKTMERALRDSAARLAGLVETAMDAIVVVDGDLRVVIFNNAAERLFGVSAEQAMGQTVERFIPERLRHRHAGFMAAFASDDQPARHMALQAVAPGADFHSGGPTTRARRLTALRADGVEFPIEASISRSGEGGRLMLMAAVRDISGELEAEKALQARLAAEAASRAKTDFLSRMSHELRTPLNAILGFSQLLQADKREPLSDRQRGQVDLIRQAGWHLLALINDVLDVSRIEAGKLNVESVPLSLQGLLDEALPLVQSLAERHAVSLAADYRGGPDRQVIGDPVRLRQVMLNVIGNAVKYNQHGGSVHIDVRPGVKAGEVCIQVEDTGIGMTPGQLGQLFEPFNRLGREHGNIEGTGIGMALTKQLVDLMEGHLEVHSTVGAGTVVRIHLPRPAGQAEPDAPSVPALPPVSLSDPSQARGGVVLCIEDDPVNAVIVQQLLGRWPGVVFRHVVTGREGLELAAELQPTLVLLDVNLPDLDGLEVLAMLRADPRTRGLCVVMLSGSTSADSVEAALSSGARAYWAKPLDFARFITEVQQLLPPATS